MNQSVMKALNLLDYFKDHPELTLAELSELSGMPKTTLFRLISSLEASGFLVKTKYTNHDVVYQLGLKLIELGGFVADRLDYRKVALPHMKNLNERINEAVHLAVIDGLDVVYIEIIDSKKHIRLHSRVGTRVPLYAGSAPKLLLAFMDDKEQVKILKKIKLERITPETITDEDALISELEDIKRKGYSESKGEYFKDTLGFAFPIIDHTNKVIAALVVSVPERTISAERATELKTETKKAAEKISEDLGYS